MGALTPRRCLPDELPRVAAAATRIFRKPAAPGDLRREYPLLFDAANAPHLWIVERAGEILAHVGFCTSEAQLGEERARVACFGAVFTVESERGQGLSTALLTEAVADARAQGASVGLISGSRSLYQRFGFEPRPPTTFHLAPATGAAPSDLEIAVATPADGPALAALYDAEPVRFLRPPVDWRRLLDSRTVFYGPGRVLMVRRRGCLLAYAAFEGRTVELASIGPAVRAMELAGDRT